MKEQSYNKDKDQDKDSRTQQQNDLHKSKEARFKDLASREIVSLKILMSRVDADVDSFKRCGTSYTFDVGYKNDIELLKYMSVYDNDAFESSKPSWGKSIEAVLFGVVGFYFATSYLLFYFCFFLLQSYITVSDAAQDTDVGLGEADSETSPKRSL
ncbi:hypothetical protein Tco_0247483 [Tanacetum coccineum]